MKSNIVLTGFMGTGKTTIGKQLARELNKEFTDTDEMIEQQTGLAISEIFATKGENYFRELESQVVQQVAKKTNMVIATGGGVVLKKENMDALRENGIIIHLKSNVDAIIRNTSKTRTRPLLNHINTEARIIEMLKQREVYYQNHDYEIDVSLLTIRQATDKIIHRITGQKENQNDQTR